MSAANRADLTAGDWFEQIEAECERALTDVPRHPCERCAGTGGVGLPGRSPVQCSDCEGRGELPVPQHALDYLRDRVIVAEREQVDALAEVEHQKALHRKACEQRDGARRAWHRAEAERDDARGVCDERWERAKAAEAKIARVEAALEANHRKWKLAGLSPHDFALHHAIAAALAEEGR